MKYLARLKAWNFEKTATQGTDKADKSPSVSFVGAEGRHFPEPKPTNGRPLAEQTGARRDATSDPTFREDPPCTPATEARRQRVLATLAERPACRYAVTTDNADSAHPGTVVLGIGIRWEDGAISTFDMVIPAKSYDPFMLLELVGRHAGTVH